MGARLIVLLGLVCIAAIACQKNSFIKSHTVIDLTHDFSAETIYWPTAEGFQMEEVFQGFTQLGFYYEANKFCAAEHGGTHIDAPIHFAEGKLTVDEIPLDDLMGEAVVIDVSANALSKLDYQVSVSDLVSWEMENGKIPERSILLIRTGYGQFWANKDRYMGTSALGPEAVGLLHFPGLHPEGARWLVANRSITAIGLDTPSIDYGQSTLFESHQILFENNIPAFENLANLQRLPVRGAVVIALPMKIKGGSGAPLRIIALIKQ